MPSSPIYISRPRTEQFLEAIAAALDQPTGKPVVFQVHGTGGIGKTTLTRQVTVANPTRAHISAVSFGVTEGIDEPIPLMATLYKQLPQTNDWGDDPFLDKYQLYQDTLHKLETQPLSGKGTVGEEQIKPLKQLLNLGVNVAGELFWSESVKKTAGTVAGAAADGLVAMLSLKDNLQQLLQQHSATKHKRDLQQLMLEPLPQLTQAFVQGLSQTAKRTPILLVLDTYEKVPSLIDQWLWRTLLGNTNLAAQRVRVLVAGRHSLTYSNEGWRKLQQDHHWIEEYPISQFDAAETQDYLHQISITDPRTVQAITQVTKGLPYYLNWIREERLKGRELDFAQGNQAIVRLLLQGLNDSQKQVVQVAACCRWFDRPLIQYLAQQQNFPALPSPPIAVDNAPSDWFGWLTQQSFVEPTQGRFRLDDVARDVFRISLCQDDRARFQQTHTQLAIYFKGISDREVPNSSPPPAKYNNPDWRKPRAEFLYHLLFTQRADIQRQVLTHLLEATYFDQDDLVQVPPEVDMAETTQTEQPLVSFATRQFLRDLKPAVTYSYAILQANSLNYAELQQTTGLSKAAIDRAIQVCLGQPNELEGLAKFAALFYQSKRCPASQVLNYLLQAQTQVEQVVTPADPDFSSGLFLWDVGNALLKLERYEEAIAAYDHALAIQPNNHEALNNKGLALGNLGHHEEAIVAFDQALAIKPDLHEAFYNKGVALGNLGCHEEAIAAYDQALAIKPDTHEAFYNKGVALGNLGRYKEAIATYDQALAIQPDKHETFYNKGVALGNLGRYVEAISAFDQAIAINLEYHEAFFIKGVLLFQLGRDEEAVTAFDQLLYVKSEYPEAFFIKGMALRFVERHEEAIAAYDQALAIKPDLHDAFYNKGIALGNLGRYVEAIAAYDQALAIKPDDHDAFYSKGFALLELERYVEAIAAYDQALAIKPDYHGTFNNKGIALVNLERYVEAIAAYDQALAIKPDNPNAFYGKACCYGLQKNVVKAVEFLQQAIALNPKLREYAKTDSDFDGVRDDERFRAVVDTVST